MLDKTLDQPADDATHGVLLFNSYQTAASSASKAGADSAHQGRAIRGHVLGGYWIASAVLIIALGTAYYRRRFGRSKP